MATLQPRPPYSEEELARLYPSQVSLQLVQIIARHGERSPVSSRFQNAGLSPHWPYCNAARFLSEPVLTENGSFDSLSYRRRLETFAATDDAPILTRGPNGEIDNICDAGELTDKGRQTTLALGQRLRHLYVNQLGFMPMTIDDADSIYLRSTPIPRALHSLVQIFGGIYPRRNRTPDFKTPTILTRTLADEDLFPNEGNCQRLRHLGRAFAKRTAERWNDTEDMDYVNKMIGKWMPDDSKRVAVDSKPRLSGIMDTLNSTAAHGPETRLPKEFYDPRVRSIIDKIGVEEWYSGFAESQEYRKLGIGSLVADTVSRMVGHVQGGGKDGALEVGGPDPAPGKGRGGETSIKMGISGAHDVTLAAFLTSLGAFDGEVKKWPPYTSHIAVELFAGKEAPAPAPQLGQPTASPTAAVQRGSPDPQNSSPFSQWFSRLFGLSTPGTAPTPAPTTVRTPLTSYSPDQRQALENHYVRIRYNDIPVSVPGCRPAGKHLDGDESFCTLAAFKEIVDGFTPVNWKEECLMNLDRKGLPELVPVIGMGTVEEGLAGAGAATGRKGPL